ncbi:hypothetical protein DIPPA_30600 [Diplonema papillatum]|nr:hypothetical protein DIPPA_30600 [Diplonema papillatum]
MSSSTICKGREVRETARVLQASHSINDSFVEAHPGTCASEFDETPGTLFIFEETVLFDSDTRKMMFWLFPITSVRVSKASPTQLVLALFGTDDLWHEIEFLDLERPDEVGKVLHFLTCKKQGLLDRRIEKALDFVPIGSIYARALARYPVHHHDIWRLFGIRSVLHLPPDFNESDPTVPWESIDIRPHDDIEVVLGHHMFCGLDVHGLNPDGTTVGEFDSGLIKSLYAEMMVYINSTCVCIWGSSDARPPLPLKLDYKGVLTVVEHALVDEQGETTPAIRISYVSDDGRMFNSFSLYNFENDYAFETCLHELTLCWAQEMNRGYNTDETFPILDNVDLASIVFHFRQLDSPGYGILPKEAFLAALEPLGGSPDAFDAIYELFDHTAQERVQFSRFLATMRTLLFGSAEDKADLLFCMFDYQRQGWCERQELLWVLSVCAQPLDPEVRKGFTFKDFVRWLFAILDKDNDGFVTHAEFVGAVLNDTAVRNAFTSLHLAPPQRYETRYPRQLGQRFIWAGHPHWELVCMMQRAIELAVSKSRFIKEPVDDVFNEVVTYNIETETRHSDTEVPWGKKEEPPAWAEPFVIASQVEVKDGDLHTPYFNGMTGTVTEYDRFSKLIVVYLPQAHTFFRVAPQSLEVVRPGIRKLARIHVAKSIDPRAEIGICVQKREDGLPIVAGVRPGTPAHKVGLQAGMVIESMDGFRMPDKRAVDSYIDAWKGGFSETLDIGVVLRDETARPDQLQVGQKVTLADMAEAEHNGKIGTVRKIVYNEVEVDANGEPILATKTPAESPKPDAEKDVHDETLKSAKSNATDPKNNDTIKAEDPNLEATANNMTMTRKETGIIITDQAVQGSGKEDKKDASNAAPPSTGRKALMMGSVSVTLQDDQEFVEAGPENIIEHPFKMVTRRVRLVVPSKQDFGVEFDGIPKGPMFVKSILPDGPADRANLQVHSIVKAINGVPTPDLDTLRDAMEAWKESGAADAVLEINLKAASTGIRNTGDTPPLVRDYSPRVFSAVRAHLGISDDDYLHSVGLTTAKASLFTAQLRSWQELKAGTMWYATHDRRFIICGVTKQQVLSIMGFLPEYFTYIQAQKDSFLTRYLGLHAMHWNKTTIYFVVMLAVVPSPHKELASVTALNPLSFATWSKSVHLTRLARSNVLEQLNADVELLAQLGMVNYSLVLGVHTVAAQTDGARRKGTDVKLEKAARLFLGSASWSKSNMIAALDRAPARASALQSSSQDFLPLPSFQDRSPRQRIRAVARATLFPNEPKPDGYLPPLGVMFDTKSDASTDTASAPDFEAPAPGKGKPESMFPDENTSDEEADKRLPRRNPEPEPDADEALANLSFEDPPPHIPVKNGWKCFHCGTSNSYARTVGHGLRVVSTSPLHKVPTKVPACAGCYRDYKPDRVDTHAVRKEDADLIAQFRADASPSKAVAAAAAAAGDEPGVRDAMKLEPRRRKGSQGIALVRKVSSLIIDRATDFGRKMSAEFQKQTAKSTAEPKPGAARRSIMSRLRPTLAKQRRAKPAPTNPSALSGLAREPEDDDPSEASTESDDPLQTEDVQVVFDHPDPFQEPYGNVQDLSPKLAKPRPGVAIDGGRGVKRTKFQQFFGGTPGVLTASDSPGFGTIGTQQTEIFYLGLVDLLSEAEVDGDVAVYHAHFAQMLESIFV